MYKLTCTYRLLAGTMPSLGKLARHICHSASNNKGNPFEHSSQHIPPHNFNINSSKTLKLGIFATFSSISQPFSFTISRVSLTVFSTILHKLGTMLWIVMLSFVMVRKLMTSLTVVVSFSVASNTSLMYLSSTLMVLLCN